jgi:hypothetical protein
MCMTTIKYVKVGNKQSESIRRTVYCKLLYVMTDNDIIWLMWYNLPILTKSQKTIYKLLNISRRFAYCIIWLTSSVSFGSKPITLNGFHCISQHLYSFQRKSVGSEVLNESFDALISKNSR